MRIHIDDEHQTNDDDDGAIAPPQAAARIGDALLLSEGGSGRALWQGRPAAVNVQYVGAEDGRKAAGMARTIGREGALPLSPVRVAVVDVDEQGRAVVVYEQDSGVAWCDVVARVMREPARRFPVDVACRLALHVASATTWMPRMGDFVVTWDGRLRASPVPMVPGGGRSAAVSDDIRFLSTELVRGEPMNAARDALYAAGVLAYELLAGASPVEFDKEAGAFALIAAVFQNERVPLLRRRADLGEPLGAAIDAMVARLPEQRATAANARAVLGARACSDDDAASFLAGFLADAFPRRRAADLVYWEQARTLDAAAAPPWNVEEVPPVADLTSTWRSLANRATRTD